MGGPTEFGWVTPAGILHDLNLFIIFVEGQTSWLGLPFVVGMGLFGWVKGREHFKDQPVLAFFSIAALTAVVFFLGWGLYWGGLPEFSAVGIID